MCNDCYKRFARYEGKANEGNDDPNDDEIPATHYETFKCQHSTLVNEIRDIFDADKMDRNVCAKDKEQQEPAKRQQEK
ncbi:hypothetical protein R1flu_016930 [Riccia fluitans]|uniref:Uncharacterized protein n=1 Tax=Riccia fluitans TaxID=41844 RepID=A0ABD1YRB9_9MARC